MSNFKKFCTNCVSCGGTTSKSYARTNAGKCKACVTGEAPKPRASRTGDWRFEHKRKTGRCEDAPCCGCCGPHGDGDYYGTSAMERSMEPYD